MHASPCVEVDYPLDLHASGEQAGVAPGDLEHDYVSDLESRSFQEPAGAEPQRRVAHGAPSRDLHEKIEYVEPHEHVDMPIFSNEYEVAAVQVTYQDLNESFDQGESDAGEEEPSDWEDSDAGEVNEPINALA